MGWEGAARGPSTLFCCEEDKACFADRFLERFYVSASVMYRLVRDVASGAFKRCRISKPAQAVDARAGEIAFGIQLHLSVRSFTV